MDINNPVLGLIKKVLNTFNGERTISKQECVLEIARLPLTFCSEEFVEVRANGYYRIVSEANKKDTLNTSGKNILTKYATRDKEDENMSLSNFFYNRTNSENKILHITGLNGTPTYPITSGYAKTSLILYKPWKGKSDLSIKSDKDAIESFKSFLKHNTCPRTVKRRYQAAKQLYNNGSPRCEPTTKDAGDYEDTNFENDNDEYSIDGNAFRALSTFQKETVPTLNDNGREYDMGKLYDWFGNNKVSNFVMLTIAHVRHSSLYQFIFKRTIMNLFILEYKYKVKEGTLWLNHMVQQVKRMNQSQMSFNERKQLDMSLVDNIEGEQRYILFAVITKIFEWLNHMSNLKQNEIQSKFQPLHATIYGKAGTGKSHLIRVLVNCIEFIFQRRDCVFIAAPTGVAASNVGGETIHRVFSINPKNDMAGLSNEQEDKLKQKFSNIVALIIDERSMLGNINIACAEQNCRKAAYKGLNYKKEWGGVPIVLVIGDDCQLPPVKATGVIQGYYNNGRFNSRNHDNRERLEVYGYRVLMNLTNICFVLTKSFRQNEKEQKLNNLLEMLRVGQVNDDGAKELMKYHLNNPVMKYSQGELKEITRDATYLYATHAPKDKKNYEELHNLHTNENPIAAIKTKWARCNGTSSKVIKNHFERDDLTKLDRVNICIGAKVSINKWNFDPQLGLYNHAFGTVVDINYGEGKNPNNGDLPNYVAVNFPGLTLPPHVQPWDEHNPKVTETKPLKALYTYEIEL